MSDDAIISYAGEIVVRVRHNAAVRVEMSEQGPQGPAGDITPAMLEALATSVEVKEQAEQAAANAAASAAESLANRNAAAAAQTGAETARTGANSERVAAETARSGAETARTGAETARTGAQTARTGAETARTGAEAAQGLTEVARDIAIGARIEAQTAQTGAEAALSGAAAAEQATVTLRDETLDILNETEIARDRAITAAEQAESFTVTALAFQPAPASGTNLNSVLARGIYMFAVAADATTALNFPANNRSGRLVVMTSGSKVVQEYTDDQAANGWLRLSLDNGVSWTAWENVWNSATMPAPSQAEAEAGSATAARAWSAQRIRQNVAAYASPLGHSHVVADVTGLQTLLDNKAALASPALTGTPTAPTAAVGANNTQLATTAFVKTAIDALVAAAPSALDTLNELAAALGDDPNFATTITNQIAGKADTVHTHVAADITDLAAILDLKAPLASPAFTGTPTAPTPTTADNSTKIATTAHVQANMDLAMPKAGGIFTGPIVFSDFLEGVTLAGGGKLVDQNTGGNTNAGRTAIFANNDSFEVISENGSQSIFSLASSLTAPLWKGNIVWHAGNFDPASKANVAGPTFSGAITLQSAYPVINLIDSDGTTGQKAFSIDTNSGVFHISRISDDGQTWIDSPLTISRASGIVSFQSRPVWAGVTPWDSGNFDPSAKVDKSAAVAITGSLGPWSTSGWATGIQLKQGTGIQWLSNGNTAAGFVGISGNTLYVALGNDALTGAGAPTYLMSLNTAGLNVNNVPVITASNFTSYFSMRRSPYGNSAEVASGAWSGGNFYGPAGTFVTAILINSGSTHLAYYQYVQYYWNGTWYTISG